MTEFPIAVNLHLTNRCNYHCKFCFARNRSLGKELTFNQWKKLIDILSKKGCLKINFAGGEPFLIPFLPKLIQYAKDSGFFTSIISNGSLISKKSIASIKENIDLIGLSLDSPVEEKERILGRGYQYQGKSSFSHVTQIIKTANIVKSENISLKINTTLTSLTWEDNFIPVMSIINPDRWKILKVHHTDGINDAFFREFTTLEKYQIKEFLERHKKFNPIFENEDILSTSYCIITPDGRFYFDRENSYSPEILHFGIDECFKNSSFSQRNFIQRKGQYFLSEINNDVKINGGE